MNAISSRPRAWAWLAAGLVLVCALLAAYRFSGFGRLFRKHYTVQQRLRTYGEPARARWKPYFEAAGLAYPPKGLAFVGLKDERLLEVYALGDAGDWRFVRSYPVLAASGALGPKTKYGDCQVPEGIYRVTFLNANSVFHLSLRLNYPNEFDRRMARRDRRRDLGTDIMIHGGAQSVGCLAMGDQAAEDLFVLAADVGIERIKVILSPVDFRMRDLPPDMPEVPAWTVRLYEQIRQELRALPPSS